LLNHSVIEFLGLLIWTLCLCPNMFLKLWTVVAHFIRVKWLGRNVSHVRTNLNRIGINLSFNASRLCGKLYSRKWSFYFTNQRIHFLFFNGIALWDFIDNLAQILLLMFSNHLSFYKCMHIHYISRVYDSLSSFGWVHENFLSISE